MTSKPGFEEIPLDLTMAPSVEEGLAAAAVRYRAFIEIARDALGRGPDAQLFREHLTVIAFTNRASSLHKGIVSAVREENPHAAFTLLRAYLEAVVTLLYIDSHPEYVAVLERPMRNLPPRSRKRFDELFEFAAGELRGVRSAYSILNEMAHFGSTALWQPFRVTDGEDGSTHFDIYTGPRWRGPDDSRIALTMLKESDEAMAEVLRRYNTHHVTPLVEGFSERQRIREAFVSAGAMPNDDANAIGIVPPSVGVAATEAGLLTWCSEHDAYELADGITAADIEAWVARAAPDRPEDTPEWPAE